MSLWTDLDLQQSALIIAIVTVTGGLIILSLIICGPKRTKSTYRLPPGPRPWPIIGNLGLLGPLPHQNFTELAKEYGPIFLLRLGNVNTVVISPPKIAGEILKTPDQNFAYRPFSTHGNLVTYGHQNVVYSPYGPYWRHARKVFTLELFPSRRLQQFQNKRKEEVLRSVQSILIECKDEKPVRMDRKFSNLIINNITRMAFDKRFFGSQYTTASAMSEGPLYEETYRQLFTLATVFIAGDYIPILRTFDFHSYKRQIREAAKKSDEILENIINEHTWKHNHATGEDPATATDGEKDDDVKDIVDVLLTRPAPTATVDADEERPLTRDQVKAILQDILMAGTDTSITTLEWALTELLRNPKVLEKSQCELDKVVGRDRLVEESDLPHLPYFSAVVKETFRLHPVVPLLIPREALEPCNVAGGYHIPKKCRVFINVWAMGRDPTIWEQPLKFDLEKFMTNGVDGNGQHFQFLPFGGGRRICPARNLGLTMVEYTLAMLLHTCHWTTLPRHERSASKASDVLDLQEAPGLTIPKAIPLEALATPRIPRSIIFRED